MKNILVPTDFSDYAQYALDFATSMAKIYKANIFVFHNINEKRGFWSSQKSEKEKFHDKNVNENRLKEKFAELKASMDIDSSRVRTFYANGDLVQNIEKYIDEFEIDFMVMGSHGASGKNEYFIGSNTQKVVRSVPCPVFVVKIPIENYSIDKVVFASSFEPDQVDTLKYLLDFLKPFDPELHLVEINTSGFYSQPYILEKEVMNDFKALCKGFKCETHFYKDYSVDAGVRHITEKIGADLIVLSYQTKNPLKRIFRGSNVEFIVNHSDVPVLSINLKK